MRMRRGSPGRRPPPQGALNPQPPPPPYPQQPPPRPPNQQPQMDNLSVNESDMIRRLSESAMVELELQKKAKMKEKKTNRLMIIFSVLYVLLGIACTVCGVVQVDNRTKSFGQGIWGGVIFAICGILLAIGKRGVFKKLLVRLGLLAGVWFVTVVMQSLSLYSMHVNCKAGATDTEGLGVLMDVIVLWAAQGGTVLSSVHLFKLLASAYRESQEKEKKETEKEALHAVMTKMEEDRYKAYKREERRQMYGR